MSSQAEFRIEHDVKLDKISVIELTKSELDELEKSRKTALDLANAEQDKIQKLRQDKEAAEAKLAALGLTADDLKALGLG